MSHSDEKRRADKQRTLCLMADRLGEMAVDTYGAEPIDPGLTDTFQTTWRELIDDALIDDSASGFQRPIFRLTALGWLRALIWSGKVDDPETRKRCTKLAQALKAVVKGRKSHYDEFVSVDEVAQNANLPPGWVFNAVKSDLLSVVFPDDKWGAEIDHRHHTLIRVSPTFGLNRVLD